MSLLKRMDDIIAWENGELSEEDTISLFQFLLDEGHCWKLQGFYGSAAVELLQRGLIFERDAEGALITGEHPDYRFSDFVSIEDIDISEVLDDDISDEDTDADDKDENASSASDDDEDYENNDDYKNFYSNLHDDDDFDDSY